MRQLRNHSLDYPIHYTPLPAMKPCLREGFLEGEESNVSRAFG
jgi:hypothetical protein